MLNRFKRDKRSANVRFKGHRQAVTGPPVIAEGIELAVPDEVFAARQKRKEVVTRVITRLLISLLV